MIPTKKVEDNGEAVLQFSLFLENKVGTLDLILETLEKMEVYVLGCSVGDGADVSIVRILVSDPDKTAHFFREKGIPWVSCEVLVVELLRGVCDLRKLVQLISGAQTNIHFLYPLLSCPRGCPSVVLHTDNIEATKSILNNSGYTIFYQGDLSR